MAWVVDTSVVLDLLTGDPGFEPASTACLQTHLDEGLVVSPVTFVELGRVAAFAERFQGLITRNTDDFRRILPTLPLVEP